MYSYNDLFIASQCRLAGIRRFCDDLNPVSCFSSVCHHKDSLTIHSLVKYLFVERPALLLEQPPGQRHFVAIGVPCPSFE